MKIDYLANLRLPTYKAHGVQITKMCEEFAALGNDVRLIVPNKHHTVEGSSDPFEYYGLKRNFTFLRIPCFDFLGMTYSFSSILYWLDLYSFLFMLSVSSAVRAHSVVYVRDPLLLIPFSPKRHTLAVEVHEIPHNPRRFYRLLSKAHAVIVLTNELKKELSVNGISENRLLVAADGVDLEQFAHPQSKSEARARLGVPQDEALAFYIGRLDSWKGLDTVYAASELLWPEVKVVIIGGDDDGEIERLQKQYPRIRFLGNRPYKELQDNQAAADVLLLPNTAKAAISSKYTSPLKLFAYMASSIPVVASDLPAIREVLNDRNATLVPADDPEALAKGIRQTLASPEASRARALRARDDVKNYTWQKRAEGILAFLGR